MQEKYSMKNKKKIRLLYEEIEYLNTKLDDVVDVVSTTTQIQSQMIKILDGIDEHLAQATTQSRNRAIMELIRRPPYDDKPDDNDGLCGGMFQDL